MATPIRGRGPSAMALLESHGLGLAMAVVYVPIRPVFLDHDRAQPTAEVLHTYSPPARKNWDNRSKG